MEVSEIKDKKKRGRYYLKGKMNKAGIKILKTLNLIDKDVIEIKEMEKYL
jgi:hypothetical protein